MHFFKLKGVQFLLAMVFMVGTAGFLLGIIFTSNFSLLQKPFVLTMTLYSLYAAANIFNYPWLNPLTLTFEKD